jgi:hypothetical protein
MSATGAIRGVVLVPADLLAARWALAALRIARRELAAGALHGIDLPDPSRRVLRGRRGVRLALWACRASCLESALVRQRYSAAGGDVRDVVIGVGRPSDRVGAHAWLDGERDAAIAGMHELTRVRAA